ncbi:MAG: GNAT family N-acetyltransferase [Clostridia bacterium]|nr:GNAT family N-acetyltransferase [Clostridia bacterium]
MKIKRIDTKKEEYMDLLLNADPDENVIKKYLQDGELYIGLIENKVACEVIITKVDEDTCELKNIAIKKDYRGKGYASELIKYVFNIYKSQYNRMIVGTTENMIPFYVLNGFKTYHHTVKNFFVDNYEEEIWDGDLHCIDMYYYAKDFIN